MSVTALFAPVADDLARVEEVIAATARVGNPAISAILGHVVATKGKRLRPALTCLAAGFHDHPKDSLARLAASIEVLHMATLVHDDLIDGAQTRRGTATIHALFDSRAAVLVGDYLFARSAALCTSAGNLRVSGVFAETLLAICDGELRQAYGSSSWRPTRAEYLRRISCKTAELFRASTEAGAILGGCDESEVDALRSYGLSLGIAFQIVDDVLDFVGDEQTLGKPTGGDLRQGIITLPALWYLEHNPDDRSIEGYILSTDDSEGAPLLDAIVTRIAGSDGIAYSLGEAREYCEQAKAALLNLPAGPRRDALTGIADYVVERHV